MCCTRNDKLVLGSCCRSLCLLALPQVDDLVLAFCTCDCDDRWQQCIRVSNSSCYSVHENDVVGVGQLRTLVAVLGFRMLVGLVLRMLVADLVFRTVVAHEGPVPELVVVVLGIVLVLVEHT